MKKTLKKIICLFLATIMLLSPMQNIVFAIGLNETKEHIHEEIEEENTVPQEENIIDEQEEHVVYEKTLYSASSDSFSTVSSAALYLREQMIARNPSVTLRFEGSANGSDVSAILVEAWKHTGVPNEGDYIRYNQVGYSYSFVTGEDGNGTYTDITYTFKWLTTAEQEAEVDAAVDSILAELDLWEATDYEKIKGAYDWVTENVDYDFNNYDDDESVIEHSTYAAVVLKEAVCQGYATLYYRLMLELGVDCRYISGMAGYVEVESHAWNIVALEGKYYNMDATWDRDLMGHYRMFLCSEAKFQEHIRDKEYTTDEWNAKYPMAVTPYVFNVAASGKLSNGIEWVLDGDTGTLTVAGNGIIPSYRYDHAPWYEYRDNISSIVISEGITEVGERSFYWSTNCTSLELPQSLTTIREYAFNNLQNIEYITLPENLKTIEFCAFSECAALKEIVIPDSVTNCETSVFSNCYGLQSAVIGNGLKEIPSSMFFGDKNLRNVTLPEGLTYIDDTAFADCGLYKITLPATLTGLGTSVFAGCRNMGDIFVEEGNQYYKSIDGVLFTKDGKTLVSYPAGDISSYYYVPNGTVTIARSAFNDAYRLEDVYFPDSLKEIKPYAFAYCSALWSVIFTENITVIGDSAFRSCKGLYSAIFENPSVTLESAVFADCDYLQVIYLPGNLKEIPNSLFYDCAKLSEITIPSTVTKIGSSAFLDCDSLTTITIPGNVKSIGQQAFDFCDRLETVIIEEGLQSIGWLAFRNNPRLRKVVIPSSVTTFERPSGTSDKTFDSCPNVTLYVNCGTAGWNYARNFGISNSTTHNYTRQTVVSPTCTAQGYTRYYCTCGSYYYDGNYVSALGHSYSSKVTAPTCTEQGYTTYTCTRCSYNYRGNYVSAKGHSIYLVGYVAPTCTTEGYSGDSVCEICGITTYGEVIPATGHIFGEWTEVTAPACDTAGQDKQTCSSCGSENFRKTYISGDENKILVSNPLPENYFEGKKILTIGDSITAGVGLSDSSNEYYGKLVADVLGMTAKNKGSSGSGYCSGGAMSTNKTLTEANVKDADVITILLGVNDWDWAVKDGYWNGKPGYYDENQTYYQLGEFDSEDTSTFYGALHEWCKEIVRINSLEGYENKQFIVITPLITSWNVSMGGTKSWDQDKLNVHGHTLRQYCTAILEVCAYYDILVFDANMFSGIYYNSPEDNNVAETGGDGVHISAKGHALLAESLAEYLLGGYSYEVRNVEDCGHSYETEIIEPSCEEEGYTLYRCPDCHNRYKNDFVPETGHTLGDWQTVTEPTPTEPGEEQRHCENCDYYESQEIPPKGYRIGDINLDGEVNVMDAYYARLVAAKLVAPTDEQMVLGDVDGDGKITAVDANYIRKFAVNIIRYFPVEA